MPLWLKAGVIVGCVALGAGGGRWIANAAAAETATAEVIADIDHGSLFRLYFNSASPEPQVASVQPGVTTTSSKRSTSPSVTRGRRCLSSSLIDLMA